MVTHTGGALGYVLSCVGWTILPTQEVLGNLALGYAEAARTNAYKMPTTS